MFPWTYQVGTKNEAIPLEMARRFSHVESFSGFKSVTDGTSERNVIVWLNEYFGRIERDGKRFEEMAAYAASEDEVFDR